MHENPEVIDLLERYKYVAIIFGFFIFLFDFSLLIIENNWIQNVHQINANKTIKSITIVMTGLFSICDIQIYNIFISGLTIIFGILYYLNNVPNKELSSNNTTNASSSNA